MTHLIAIHTFKQDIFDSFPTLKKYRNIFTGFLFKKTQK